MLLTFSLSDDSASACIAYMNEDDTIDPISFNPIIGACLSN